MTPEVFNARYGAQRRGTGCEKWDGLAENFGRADLLALWVADMEFKTPEVVTKAMEERIKQGVFGYATLPEGYAAAVSEWQRRRHGCPVQEEWLRFSHGVVEALHQLVAAFTRPGDAVLIMTPVYGPFYEAVHRTGRQLVQHALTNQAGVYTINFDRLEAQFKSEAVRLLISCSPHNPAGRVWEEQELQTLLALCEKYDVLLVSDEIHQDLIVGENPQIPILKAAGDQYRHRVVAVTSASKTFNLAGLIHSHIFIPNPALRKRYDQHAETLGHTATNIFGCVATQAAYGGGHAWLEGLLGTVRLNLQTMQAAFAAALPKAVLSPLEGTYLLWVDLRAYFGQDAAALQAFMQEKCGLAVNYGQWFGPEYAGFIRLNLGTTLQNVESAARQLTAGSGHVG